MFNSWVEEEGNIQMVDSFTCKLIAQDGWCSRKGWVVHASHEIQYVLGTVII